MSEILKELQPAYSAVDPQYPGLAHVKAIVAFASAKGGTGKSTMVANLATVLALKSRKVGIADADLDAPSVAAMLGVPRIHLISVHGGVDPANGPFGIRIVANDAAGQPLLNFAVEPWEPNGTAAHDYGEEFRSLDDLFRRVRFGALDLLMVDLPPGFKHAIHLSQVVEQTATVVVLPASGISISAARRALEEARRERVKVIGLIENLQGFYCGNCHSVRPLLPQSDLGALARDFGLPILGRVPFDSRLAEACDNGHPFVREYPDSPATKLITETAAALMAALATRSAAPQQAWPERQEMP